MYPLLIINPSDFMNCTVQAIRIFYCTKNRVVMNTENIIIKFDGELAKTINT